MGWGVPALWFNSWYDVSIGPNLELYNRARSANTDKEASANQFVVVAPGAHCSYNKLGPDMIVGERNMGDTSFDVDGAVFAWFDRWLKGDTKAFPSTTPHVRYYAMGTNKWRSSSQWPPAGTQPLRFYLRSSGRQRGIEARQDVLVYTSDPLETPLEVTGFVDAVLKISSNAKDTDFAVKLVDVSPDGTAWIIGDTILRTRYRDGFDRPIPMRAGQVYTIHPTPIATSIQFGKGHRIRVEVTSSNFPKFVRNLNTGGPNESESQPVVADNEVYHSVNNFSYIELPVVR
jgi:predicted acyl esterase